MGLTTTFWCLSRAFGPERGIAFKGVLYAGLILTGQGAKVLEFNTRFGDPETEALMPLFAGDLVEVMTACAKGRLGDVEPVWSNKKSVTVVMASEGYPEAPLTGREITGLEAASRHDVVVFHAGTKRADGQLVTSGGRVLNVGAVGDSFEEARAKVYAALEEIEFAGSHFRRDIALPRNS